MWQVLTIYCSPNVRQLIASGQSTHDFTTQFESSLLVLLVLLRSLHNSMQNGVQASQPLLPAGGPLSLLLLLAAAAHTVHCREVCFFLSEQWESHSASAVSRRSTLPSTIYMI